MQENRKNSSAEEKKLIKNESDDSTELHVSDADECKESDDYAGIENSESKGSEKRKSEESIGEMKEKCSGKKIIKPEESAPIEKNSDINESNKILSKEVLTKEESELEASGVQKSKTSDERKKVENKNLESSSSQEAYGLVKTTKEQSKDQDVEESKKRKNSEKLEESEDEEGACALPPEYYASLSDINIDLLLDLIENNSYIKLRELSDIMQQPENVIYKSIRDVLGYEYVGNSWIKDNSTTVILDIREDRRLWRSRIAEFNIMNNLKKSVSFEVMDDLPSSETPSTSSTALSSPQSTPSPPQEEDAINILFEAFRDNPTISVEQAATIYNLPLDYVQLIYYDYERQNIDKS